VKYCYFFFIAFVIQSLSSKGQAPFTLSIGSITPVQFCYDPVIIAPNLSAAGSPSVNGMKISFTSGYIQGEDMLIYPGNLKQTFNASTGTLELTGSTDIQVYMAQIQTVKYKNLNPRPTPGIRKITISLNDVDYLPQTGHFYRFVSKPNLSWTAARDEAALLTYYGLKGYLVTITEQAETDFIRLKTKSVGWIGASDAALEGDWRWKTGPEGTEDNGLGRLFWRGTGADFSSGVKGKGPIAGQYQNWNVGEPNNVGSGEHYAHILYFSTDPVASYKWNDLPNSGGSGDYASKGYLVEFGGFSNEHDMNLTATLDLQVNTIIFNPTIDQAICEGSSVSLNKPDNSAVKGVYSWTPATSLSNPSVANPVASPTVTTTYKVVCTRGICKDSTSYIVNVNPKPVSLLSPEVDICKGQTKILDPGPQISYLWNGGSKDQTINVSMPGNYQVVLTGQNGCKGTFASKVTVHDYPTVDLSKLDTLICGASRATLVNITSSPGSSFSLSSTDSKVTVNDLNVSSGAYGTFPMVYKSAIYAGCAVEKPFILSFFKKPTVDFTINAKKCSGYNLDVSYSGDADTLISNFKWVFGNSTIADSVGLNSLIVPLGINRSQRDLSLTVTQDGCSNTVVQKDISVIPNLSLRVLDSIGCEPFKADFIALNSETVTYDWTFGDGTPVERTVSHPSHTYQRAGFYPVKLKVSTIVSAGESCTNEVVIDSLIHVAPIPDVAFSISADSCLNLGGHDVFYNGLIGTARDNYVWDLSNFDPSEISSDPHQTKGPLGFDLKTKPQVTIGLKVVSEFGCESVSKDILLKRKPDFSMDANLFKGCVPFSPALTGKISDPVDLVNFNWDFGDGSSASGNPVSPVYTNPNQNYIITLMGTSSLTGCSNTLVIKDSIATFPKPHAEFMMSDSIIYNDNPTVAFTNKSSGSTGQFWDFGDNLTSDISDPNHTYQLTGYRNVLLNVSNSFSCLDTISHKLLIAFDRIFPPTGFSPNAPNLVDRVFLLNSDGIRAEGYHLSIYSRWDDLVFEVQNQIAGWDGRMPNGSFAPAGVYVWVFNFTDFLGRKHLQTGTVTLVY
jgi:PKD domain/CHU_C Type IX secretion signal domain